MNHTTHELVAGQVAPGFEAVRQAFAANMDSGLEVGASFAVTLHGECVVDLWGGYTDESRSTPLQRDALFNLWSTTKGLAASCIALLVERSKVNYESPVAEYWPEFARSGKQAVTVGQLLSHQAGVCGPREPVILEDYYAHERVASLLAAQAPLFEPGSAWGYHALALGTLADELVRRVDGRTLSQFFAAELATPLVLDAFMGLPQPEDHRQVKMIRPPGAKIPAFSPPNSAAYEAALENPVLDPDWPNSRRWRAAGIAGAGGSGNARSLARLYGVLANGGKVGSTRLFSPNTISEAARERIAGVDQVSGTYSRYAAGFRLSVDGSMGPHPESFGHPGWGGSVAFADPQQGVGVAYVMNQMLVGNLIGNRESVDPRLLRLLTATYAVLKKN